MEVRIEAGVHQWDQRNHSTPFFRDSVALKSAPTTPTLSALRSARPQSRAGIANQPPERLLINCCLPRPLLLLLAGKSSRKFTLRIATTEISLGCLLRIGSGQK